ncbi:PAS domain-containing protein, partial [bacterium]|nr:PAS domain-containing protein [bacterium]
MVVKPSYEELEQRVRELEEQLASQPFPSVKNGRSLDYEAAPTGTANPTAPQHDAVHDPHLELQRSRKDLASILDNLPFLAWLKDTEGRFIAVNEPFAVACGHQSPDEVIGKTDLDVWPRELAEAYRADDREVMESGEKKNVEE